jgi:pimeloyl-ACP methyl ester carboxylesterase
LTTAVRRHSLIGLDRGDAARPAGGPLGGMAMHRERLGAVRFQCSRLGAAVLTVSIALIGIGPSRATATATITTHTGRLSDGATFLMEVPADWNGTLALYSHGYVAPGEPNPAEDVGDPFTRQWLLSHGYALAGSSYATKGWAIKEAIPDQIATLNKFGSRVGKPKRTIAWGHSLGGIITAGLLQVHPDRFTAALPMCGVLAGGVGTWNQALDTAFAIQQLLGAGSGLQVVNITNPPANLTLAEQELFAAQATPQGKARIALASALGDIPGWFDPASPEPAATDFAAQEANQFSWATKVDAPFAFALRAELEARAGGNPSWNTGVNYVEQLEKSADFAEVQALYTQAGQSLQADLATLNSATRITANDNAVKYLTQNIVFNGDIEGRPFLTLHTTGDGLVVNQDEQAYRSVVQDANDSQLLRQAFVHRAGHCQFTPAETISAFQALVRRIDTGHWTGTTPAALNAAASALGSPYNVVSPSFIAFHPTPFERPFDLRSH